MSQLIVSLVLQYAAIYGVDPHLVLAVIETESQFNVNAVGEKGEVGLMQLIPAYFPKYSRQELFEPSVNIMLGVRHLAEAKKACKHRDQKTWVVCYNVGIVGGSKIRHPKLFPYYKKVYPIYERLKNVQERATGYGNWGACQRF